MEPQSTEIAKCEDLDRQCEQQTTSMKMMIAQITPQFVMTHGRDLVQGCKELMALSIQNSAYLDSLDELFHTDVSLCHGSAKRI